MKSVEKYEGICKSALPLHQHMESSIDKIEGWNEQAENMSNDDLVLIGSIQLLQQQINQRRVRCRNNLTINNNHVVVIGTSLSVEGSNIRFLRHAS